MNKEDNKLENIYERLPKKARYRIDGPSVVMRVPGRLEADVRAFVDLVADYINRPPYGEVKELPPSRTTDAERRRLCSLLVSLADFETERQRLARRRAEDRRQLSLFGTGGSPVSEGAGQAVCHLLRVNERSFAYTDSVRETGYACFPRVVPCIGEGDTVFLLVRDRRERLSLFRMRVDGLGPFPSELSCYALRPTLRNRQVSLLRFLGSHRGGELTAELLEQQGIRRHTAHLTLSDGQAAWLGSWIDNEDWSGLPD